jgi:hypothetical protein
MTDSISTKNPSRELLSEMLARAVYAPSGDNSQPWRFRLGEGTITLLNTPDADGTQYNYNQRGSYFAHGALIENLSILAGEKGYALDITLFPPEKDVTAIIAFKSKESAADPLANEIERRSTNRKPYKRIPLDAAGRDRMLGAVKKESGVQLRFLEERGAVDSLATTVSVNEQLLMENRTLHDFLFGIIRWSKEEEKKTPGLYLKTMELPPPVQILFRFVLKHWSAVELLNHIGLSKFIPKQSAPVYAASSAFGAIILSGNSNADFAAAGRAFERVWLTANIEHMSIQPVTAIPYLAQRVKEGAASAFTKEHQELIRKKYATIASAFHLEGSEHIAMLFRIGYGDRPTATSSKLPPIFLDK